MTTSEIEKAQRLMERAIQCATEAEQAARLKLLFDKTGESREILTQVTRTLVNLKDLKQQLEAAWAS